MAQVGSLHGPAGNPARDNRGPLPTTNLVPLPPQTNKGNHWVVALEPIITINAAGLPPHTHLEDRSTAGMKPVPGPGVEPRSGIGAPRILRHVVQSLNFAALRLALVRMPDRFKDAAANSDTP